MVTEVVELLRDRGLVLDLTLGSGGHAEALLAAGVDRIVGVDRDPVAVSLAAERLAGFGDRVRIVQARFSEVGADVAPDPVDGVLYDLGLSSMQVDRGERGFSFRVDGPLDMRMGDDGRTAADLVNELPQDELADLIFQLGGERRSRQVAAAIVRNRTREPIETTDRLASIVVGAVGRRPGGPHPARRTFQALRIAVNRELEELAASLPRAVGLLGPGGRVIVISYHSLEDGMVKRTFRGDDRLHVLYKHPLRPSPGEIAANPRARSAHLRAAERLQEAA